MEGAAKAGGEEVHDRHAQGKAGISKKIIVLAVVAVLLGSSGLYVWYQYFRHWSIGDLEDALVLAESDEYPGQGTLSFEPGLDGRTVTVEGVVSNTYRVVTNLGELTVIYPEGGTVCSLCQWGDTSIAAGDRFEIRVSFQRATINGLEGVYSPQVAAPGLGVLASIGVVMSAVSWVLEEFVISIEESDGQVVVRLEKASEPVPLEMSRCDLRKGVSGDVLELLDILHYYDQNPVIDAIEDLRTADGGNDTIHFSDSNADGYLDDGDFFVLSNLTRPTSDCGAETYLLQVERERYPEEPQDEEPEYVFLVYLIMTKSGPMVARDPQSAPKGTAFCSSLADGESFTVDYLSEQIGWGNVTIELTDWIESVEWDPSLVPSESWNSSTSSLGTRSFLGTEIECIVSQESANDLVGTGDVIELVARDGGGLETGESYTFRLIDKDTRGSIVSKDFIFRADPLSRCALEETNAVAATTFGPVYNGTNQSYLPMDVVWDEVSVRLDSEGTDAEWNLTSAGLDTGDPASWISEVTGFGELYLECSVTDLQGNGLIDAGDLIEISVISGGVFDPSAEYTLSVIYLPTGANVFSGTFSV